MTVIAGLVEDDAVWMAADSATYDGRSVLRPEVNKISRIPFGDGEELLVGFAGHCGLAQAIVHRLQVDGPPRNPSVDDVDHWAWGIAEQVYALAKEHGLLHKEDGGLDGAGLMAWRHHLWHVSTHCALPIEKFTAVGSGAEMAIGAMDALVDSWAYRHDPTRIVGAAVAAACRWEGNCQEPIQVTTTHQPSPDDEEVPI